MAIRRRPPSSRPREEDDQTGIGHDPNLDDRDSDGISDEDEAVDEAAEDAAAEAAVEEILKPWVGYRDPKVPLTPAENAAILAHEDRIVQHNVRCRELGVPEALTKEEQDRVP